MFGFAYILSYYVQPVNDRLAFMQHSLKLPPPSSVCLYTSCTNEMVLLVLTIDNILYGRNLCTILSARQQRTFAANAQIKHKNRTFLISLSPVH